MLLSVLACQSFTSITNSWVSNDWSMQTVNSQSATIAHTQLLLLLLFSVFFCFFFCPCRPTTSSHWLSGEKATGLLTLPSSPRTARNQTCLSVYLPLCLLCSLFFPQHVSLSSRYQQLEGWNAPPDSHLIIDFVQPS